MADLIDRQMAINHIKKRLIETAINNVGFVVYADDVYRTLAEYRIDVWIKELPTAEPQILSEILSELTKKERTDRYHVWTTNEVKQWFADRIMERGQDGEE